MQVSDLMSRIVISTVGTTPVLEARALMQKEHIRHLLVVGDGRVQGIVTDRDIRLNMPSPATSLSVWEVNHLLARLTVDRVMTRTVITIGPDRDARDAAQIMVDHKIGALPVLNGERLLGIVTETDLLRAFVESTRPAAAVLAKA